MKGLRDQFITSSVKKRFETVDVLLQRMRLSFKQTWKEKLKVLHVLALYFCSMVERYRCAVHYLRTPILCNTLLRQ